MSFSVHKFATIVEMGHYLNGGIIGGVDISRAGVVGLVGLTLTFTRPAFSVTFTDPGTGVLRLPDIKQQIEAASTHIQVVFSNGCVVLVEKTPTLGVALDPVASQQARVILGFPKTGTVEGRVIKQMFSATAPRLEGFEQSSNGSYVVVIWED
jgi:hypothetical protein